MKKRIALSAVVALFAGLLAAAPASAAAGDYNASISNSAATVSKLTGYSAGSVATLTINMAAKAGDSLDSAQQLTVTATGAAATANLIAFNDTGLTTSNTSGNATLGGFANNVADNTFTVNPTAAAASGITTTVAKINVYLLGGASTGDVTFTVTDSGANLPLFTAGSNVATMSLEVGNVVARTNTLGATSGTVAAGASTTVTVTDAFTALAGETATLTVNTGSTDIRASVAAGAATGGAAAVTATTPTTATVTNIKNAIDGAYTVTHTVTLTAISSALGSYSITIGTKSYTLTVNPSTGAYARTKVEAGIGLFGSGFYNADGDGVMYGSKAINPGTEVGSILITQIDVNGNPVNISNSKEVLVTLSGVGSFTNVSTVNPASTQYLVISASTMVGGGALVDIYADGRAGTGTVSVSVGGTVVDTLTVKFYGNATKVTATPIYSIGKAGGGQTGAIAFTGQTPDAANNPAIAVLATDANGTPVPVPYLAALFSTVSDPLVLDNSLTNAEWEDGSAVGTFYTHVDFSTAATAKSGDKATMTFTVVNGDGTTVSSAPVAISVGGAVATVTLSLDKATYAQGEKATLTISAKDSSGNPVYDGATMNGTLSTNVAAQGFTVAGKKAVGGKATATVYAPTATGTWTISGLDVNAAAISVSATVNSAADLAAAQAAIAALQTSVAALQTTVASLVASLTAQIKVINTALRKIAAKMKVKL